MTARDSKEVFNNGSNKKKELSRKRRQNYRSLDGIEKKITSQT